MEAFNKIKTEYLEFRQKLENDINSSPNLNTSEDCFLIEESYIKKIGNNNIKPNLSNSFKNLKEALKIPKIINDFEDAIKHIYFNIQLKLISIKIFELMGFKNILKDTNIVNYFAGNKKLIIEFKKEGGNKALLLNNYSDDIQSKNNIFIINKSKDIYKNILNNINYLNDKEIISFYNYIGKDSIINNQKKMNIISKKINTSNNNMKNTNFSNNQETLIISNRSGVDNENLKEIKENENEENFKKDLIKIFINVFYYEQLCSNKKTNIFNNKEIYYIINPDWLANYKKYYNYEQLENLLKKENKNINYFKLVNCLKNVNILNFEKKDLSQELKTNIAYIITSNYNISYLLKGLIIPSKIIKIIKNIHHISIKPNEVYFNDNNIYFIKNKNIIVGNYNDIPKILTKYVFSYKDNTFNSEKKEIVSHEIDEYIRLRKCKDNIKELQILRNENNEEIGKFFIVTQNNKDNSLNESKLLKENTKKRLKAVYIKNRNISIFKDKKGNEKYFSPNIKNNKINNNSPNLNHRQNIINLIHNKSNLDNNYNITSNNNLSNKNIEDNLINVQQINDNMPKDLDHSNIEIIKLKKQLLRTKDDCEKIRNINLKYKKELSKAKNIINNYKKKEEQYKRINELMNEISKKENEFNKKINFLEDKEKLLEKEKLDFENKKREFQKEIENYKQENDDLNKKKFELENQIKEKEKQLNNLNNKILKNQEESGQNYHNTNYKNNSQNDNDTVLSKSIGASTLIKNIENRRNNQININQMNNILMNNNLMNNNLMSNNLMNNNLMKNNQMNNYLDDNNNNIFEINNNSI